MSENYYRISVSYEIPYNVIESTDDNVISAKNIFLENIKAAIPEEKYDRLFAKLTLHQLKDTFNFILSYDAFIRSTGDLPMEEYVSARDLKDKIKEEIEEFFNTVDCEYRQINIKTLL